jgi:hypothetical protein
LAEASLNIAFIEATGAQQLRAIQRRLQLPNMPENLTQYSLHSSAPLLHN